MSRDLPSDMQAKIRTISRDQKRLEAECKVRLEYNMPVLTEKNRLKFHLLVIAKLHPNTPLGKWVNDMVYADAEFFEKMDLTSIATIERDNREIERVGLFMKEKEQPKAVQQLPQQLTL